MKGSGIYVSGEPVAQFFDPSLSDGADERFLVSSIPRTMPPLPSSAITTVSPMVTSPMSYSRSNAANGESFVECGVIGSKILHCSSFKSRSGASGSLSASYGPLSCNLNYTFADDATEGEVCVLG